MAGGQGEGQNAVCLWDALYGPNYMNVRWCAIETPALWDYYWSVGL